jgi:hypothetical protein
MDLTPAQHAVAAAEREHSIVLVQVFRHVPRPVVAQQLDRREQLQPRRQRGGTRADQAPVLPLAESVTAANGVVPVDL